MNTNKYLIAGLATTLLVGATSFALANNGVNLFKPGERDDQMEMKMKKGMEMAEKARTQMILQIGPAGNTLLRGTVELVNTTSNANAITVKTWGGNWIVNIPSGAKVLPEGSTLSQFQVGDFVGVEGKVNTSAAFTVDARLVKNWNARKTENELQNSFTPRNIQGTASDVNATANTFTLTVDGKAYTVSVAAGAKIVNQSYSPITLSQIMSGHTVRVWATVSGTTLTAFLVRDVSI